MNGRNEQREDHVRRLMMQALDDELSAAQRAELDRLLADDECLRAEWEKLRKVKEVTETMDYRNPPQEIWQDYWVSVFNRFERGLGWTLVSVGAAVLVGYALWHQVQSVLADSGMPAYLKIAIFAVLMGGIILLLSVAREKLFTRRHDPYKGVQR